MRVLAAIRRKAVTPANGVCAITYGFMCLVAPLVTSLGAPLGAFTLAVATIQRATAEPLSGPLSGPPANPRKGAQAERNAAPRDSRQTNPCSAYGPGFVPAAGGTTCVKLGGRVIMEFSTGRGQNAFGDR